MSSPEKSWRISAIKNKTIERVENKYNRAENVLKKKQQTDLTYFIPSEIANTNPEADRVILINNLKNGGVGAAIARGYKWCLDNNIDCTASMDGDGQMDPAELESICRPIVKEEVDCVKGNRLIHGSAPMIIPKTRYIGNAILSISPFFSMTTKSGVGIRRSRMTCFVMPL